VGEGAPSNDDRTGSWWIADHRAQTALEFFELLSPATGLFARRPSETDRVFRGLDTVGHALIPAAWRRGVHLTDSDRWYVGPRKVTAWQIQAEVGTVWEFFRLADRRGLRLPEDSQLLRQRLDKCREHNYIDEIERGRDAWPPTELLSLLAVAQHYGIPTRLLDWTENPYVAGYFAAKGAARQLADEAGGYLADKRTPRRPSDERTSELAVLALSRISVEVDKILNAREDDRRPVRIVTAPAADIPNLYAQQGLFLVHQSTNVDCQAEFVPRAYDEMLCEKMVFAPHIVRLSLKAECAPELLFLLARAGVDAASLFPGFKGVADAVQERALLPPVDDWKDTVTARALTERHETIDRGLVSRYLNRGKAGGEARKER
jgi:hypothetical protein